jgi:hypothetical protein
MMSEKTDEDVISDSEPVVSHYTVRRCTYKYPYLDF